MTCPVSQFGCSCEPAHCQAPKGEYLEAARSVSTGQIVILSIMFGAMVAGFSLCAGTVLHRAQPHQQEQAR